MLIWFLATALAATPTHPVTVEGGMTEFAGSDLAAGGGVYGRVAVHVKQFSADIGIREGYLAGADRMVGSITIGARYSLAKGPYFRAAFLHHHETPFELAKRFPVATTMGTLSGISHRSGGELGVGFEVPLVAHALQGRMGLNFDVAVGAFPDRGGSAVYVFLQQGFTFDVGKRRGESEPL